MKQRKFLLSLLLCTVLFVFSAKAQEESTGDTVASAIEKIQSDLSVLKRLKISGYIQTQWQKADTIGTQDKFAGSNPGFSKFDNGFSVRRGRLKVAYDNDFSQYVLQFDVTEKGVGIKDAYAAFTDPWMRAFTVTGGAFNRPFGYEIEFSSSSRESPERARIYQTLFPNERDLGAKLTFQMPKTSPLNFIKLEGGLFNGNGLGIETDKYKDFIGHLSFNKTYLNQTLAISGGLSYYNGGYAMGTKYAYKMNNGVFKVDSTSQKVGDKAKREYFGVDFQASLQSVIGISTVRAEYLWGSQPGLAGNYYATMSPTAAVAGDTYNRKFNGGLVYFVQNIGQTPFQLVYKYDWYDPNTAVKGNEIGSGSVNGKDKKTGITDIKYNTNGLGLVCRVSNNCKVTAYYDIVSNETSTNLKTNGNGTTDYSKNLKNNFLTLRLQYKF
jgi:hypothetical protein